ncbi:MAG: hypothetical protein CVV64_10620 [Candidatus Wallbacteria bacterium HGW-Wallbacteria-1]|uniref:Uncharacterized protein n=1 Tax=Candidatus Wallbacteria bacterium HGW-Wallbacteria-1 TaxID=2013854 RepID=A0A2N1PPB3_9BACT|nr:MAG: hypothetical protein CVV64_10620 [Candidatus Wallbacteria bacterium HGW-Wallbacteria-1]
MHRTEGITSSIRFTSSNISAWSDMPHWSDIFASLGKLVSFKRLTRLKRVAFSIFIICAIMISSTGCPVYSRDMSVNGLTSAEYSSIIDELCMLTSWRQMGPAEPLGLLGLEIQGGVNSMKRENGTAWDSAVAQGAPTTLMAPQIRLTKGLPFGLDIQARMGKVLDTELEFKGLSLKYAIMKGSTLTPAVSVAVAYTDISGGKDFDSSTIDLNASISKGFGPLTPYAGISWSRLTMSPHSTVTTHSDQSSSQLVKFAGFRFSFLPLSWMNLEYAAGESNSVSATVSIGF